MSQCVGNMPYLRISSTLRIGPQSCSGMLAVVFLAWALEVRLQSERAETSGDNDVIQVVFPG